ncbi:MAG: hypothetical protein HY978_04755 [Candidatus Liptonbacteria bacterium]|nr:hypothetical protein [Candidatus Liptonbacteria bacterium]
MPDYKYGTEWGTATGVYGDLDPKMAKKRRGWMVGTAIVLILILAGAATLYFANEQNNRSVPIKVEILRPDRIVSGEPFEATVTVTNQSPVMVTGTKLAVTLPEGVFFAERTPTDRYSERNLGEIPPGNMRRETFQFLALSGGQSVSHLETRVTYASQKQPSVQFEKKASTDITIGQATLELALDLPPKVLSGDTLKIRAIYRNAGNQAIQDLHLSLNYPSGFETIGESATSTVASGDHDWLIGDLSPGASGEINITGAPKGPADMFFNFSGKLIATIKGQKYVVRTQEARTVIQAAPIAVEINLENGEAYVARPGDSLRYLVAFQNRAAIPLTDVSIVATLSGSMYDLTSLETNGTYDSVDNTITWSPKNTPKLVTLRPNAEDSVAFRVDLKSRYPSGAELTKGFKLSVHAEISSPTVPPGIAASRTFTTADYDTKIAGAMELTARAFWRDAAAKILNTGPYPPRVNVPTQYTVHWILRSIASDFQKVTVSTFLQPGNRFTGIVKSNIKEQPSYDPKTGWVTWKLDSLEANRGVGSSSPVEAIFQIENTPALNQLNQYVPLIGPTKLQAEDALTASPVEIAVPEITSVLPDDEAASDGNRSVKK